MTDTLVQAWDAFNTPCADDHAQISADFQVNMTTAGVLALLDIAESLQRIATALATAERKE